MAIYEVNSAVSRGYDAEYVLGKLEQLVSEQEAPLYDPDYTCKILQYGVLPSSQDKPSRLYLQVRAINPGEALLHLTIDLKLTPYLEELQFVRLI